MGIVVVVVGFVLLSAVEHLGLVDRGPVTHTHTHRVLVRGDSGGGGGLCAAVCCRTPWPC